MTSISLNPKKKPRSIFIMILLVLLALDELTAFTMVVWGSDPEHPHVGCINVHPVHLYLSLCPSCRMHINGDGKISPETKIPKCNQSSLAVHRSLNMTIRSYDKTQQHNKENIKYGNTHFIIELFFFSSYICTFSNYLACWYYKQAAELLCMTYRNQYAVGQAVN